MTRLHLPVSALSRDCSYLRAVDPGIATGSNAQHIYDLLAQRIDRGATEQLQLSNHL